MKRTKRENNRTTPPADPLFRDAAALWLERQKLGVKESTYIKYANLLRSYALPALGALPLTRIRPPLMEELCRTLLQSGGARGQGLSAKTVSDLLSVVRSVLRFAGPEGAERAASVRLPKPSPAGKRSEPQVLSLAEQRRLCQTLLAEPSRGNLGILLCLFTGLRVGELCALRWEDISPEDGTLRVRRTLQRLQNSEGGESRTHVTVTAPKSLSSVRTVPLPEALCGRLRELGGGRSGYFLTDSERWVEPRTMQNRFKRALRKSGVRDLNYHALRHTFATRCVELNFDVKSLSEILGHSSVSITMSRYVHPSLELKKENMRRLDALLGD